MTFKELAKATLRFPGNIVTWTTGFLLGSTSRDEYGRTIKNPGLVGTVALLTTRISRSLGDFFANHRDAIAVAFWASLVVAGAALLAVSVVPGLLAAVAGFSVYGLSIAGIVGAEAIAQLAAIGILATLATSLVVYVGATINNIVVKARNDANLEPVKVEVQDPFDIIESGEQSVSDKNPRNFSSLFNYTIPTAPVNPTTTEEVFPDAHYSTDPTDNNIGPAI